jgi:hypothetical protein
MADKPDDLEAVRIICGALDPFDEGERERIMRWASEKLGIKNIVPSTSQNAGQASNTGTTPTPTATGQSGSKDIKSFLQEKNPTSANQLVAAVAYYYKFEASAAERKDSITKEDLVDACRKAQRERPTYPSQVLVNASAFGLVDKVGTGTYEINAVGENLVAVSMPTAGHGNSGTKKASSKGKKKSKK